MIDRAVLQALSASSVSRTTLEGRWLSLSASRQLTPHGYNVRIWALPGCWRTLYEYLDPWERITGHTKRGTALSIPRHGPVRLPRVTAHTYRRQAAVHLALGIALVPPGRLWLPQQSAGLFDQALLEQHEVAL